LNFIDRDPEFPNKYAKTGFFNALVATQEQEVFHFRGKETRVMKTAKILATAMSLGLALVATTARADIDVPTDGSDGVLDITTNTTIDLGVATTGTWSDASSHATGAAGHGIYDPAKWAVVFKYQSVKIHTGATLTFKNRAGNPPVVWLVAEDVVTSGTIDISGQTAHSAGLRYFTEPGPGGFRGGLGNSYASQWSGGMGPGGGIVSGDVYWRPGGYATPGGNGGKTYGNPMIIPLIGGSGASGGEGGLGGGNGGGAILIASKQTIQIDGGGILANGGASLGGVPMGGSGGAVRMIGDAILGAGPVYANGSGWAGNGRIRLEGNTISLTNTISPSPSSVMLAGAPQIWPETTHPTATIVSIGGQAISGDPRASLVGGQTDLSLSQTGTTEVIVQTSNVSPAATVTVKVVPVLSSNFSVNATLDSGTTTTATWKASVTLPQGAAAFQVRVALP
jgi:hypothetical protein